MSKEINSHQKQREWFGKIPFNWQSAKLKRLIKSASSGGTPDSSNDSFYSDAGVPWVTISDITNSSQIKNTAKHITDEAINDKNLKIYPKGTILLAMYASVGKVAELCTEASINQAILAISVDTSKMSNNYIKFCFNAYEPYIKSESNGTTQFNLNANKVLNLSFPLPTLKEQNEISKWISEKSFDIDQLISNQEKQIEKLKEYRQAIITKAVTKGLDSNAPMKDSGVEWIGKIPCTWEILRLKYCFSVRNEKYENGNYDYVALENVESFSGKYIATESNAFYSLAETIRANRNDVIFGKLRPYLSKAFLIAKDCYVSSEFAVLYGLGGNRTSFLKYLLISSKFIDVINSSTYGTKMPRANIDFIRNLGIAIPDVKTQKEIVNYLDETCSKIDWLIDVKVKKIAQLSNYKKSLIYEYVTGKKRVSL